MCLKVLYSRNKFSLERTMDMERELEGITYVCGTNIRDAVEGDHVFNRVSICITKQASCSPNHSQLESEPKV